MSEIDQYKHECIGIIVCPSTYPIVGGREHRNIPVYRVDEPAEEWEAKPGDLLLGGGRGESEALRISMPDALVFLTHEDAEVAGSLYYAYWSMNMAYVFCEGYSKLGWRPDKASIETWLTDHILAFVLREYPGVYGPLCGPVSYIEEDGSICRLPTEEEKRHW
jgi:hypothetical protein